MTSASGLAIPIVIRYLNFNELISDVSRSEACYHLLVGSMTIKQQEYYTFADFFESGSDSFSDDPKTCLRKSF